MTSFGACGDVVRNTVTCPDCSRDDCARPAADIAEATSRGASSPRPSAHWEIFVNGEAGRVRAPTSEHDFYGDTYLPRKFKIAIAHPEENCVDVLAQDVGLIPGVHPEAGAGSTLLVGGGLGVPTRTPTRSHDWPTR